MAKGMPAILALAVPKKVGEGKGKKESGERAYAKEAYMALKDDDEEGFVEAFTSAIEACVKRAKAGGYDEESEED